MTCLLRKVRNILDSRFRGNDGREDNTVTICEAWIPDEVYSDESGWGCCPGSKKEGKDYEQGKATFS